MGRFLGCFLKWEKQTSYIYTHTYMHIHICMYIMLLGFPGGSDGKESAWHAGDLGSIPRLGRSSGEGNGYPIKYSCLENPMDRGTYSPIVPIVGYSAWGHKESDMTEATQQPHVYKVTFCIRKGRNLTY